MAAKTALAPPTALYPIVEAWLLSLGHAETLKTLRKEAKIRATRPKAGDDKLIDVYNFWLQNKPNG